MTNPSQKAQLALNFKDSGIASSDNTTKSKNFEAKVVKLDPNKDLYKRILNRKSY